MTTRISQLSISELQRRLAQGLPLRTGPFVTEIISPLPLLAEGIALHYADYAIDESGFADFHVRIDKPTGLRRWYRPQIRFYFDNQPPFHPLPADQAFPMLEWGLNWCVSNHCHQYLSLHAAVAERNGKALILPAPPGSGKSTLCAALIHRGWRLLSDELTLIDPASGKIQPLPRPVSLKNQSIDVIQAFAPKAVFNPPVADTIKGTVAHMRAPLDALQRSQEMALPGWVVLPRYSPAAPALLKPMSRARGLMALIQNAFNFDLHGEAGFASLGKVIDASDCYEFSYGNLDEAMVIFEALAAGDLKT